MASNAQHLANEELGTSSSTQGSRRYRMPPFSSMVTNSWDLSYCSFSSSSFSYNEDYPIFSPTAPLKFKGIPFSWEKIPGVPKHPLGFKRKEYSERLLPPPPARSSRCYSSKKPAQQDEISPKKSTQKDPFFAAFVECSKDGDHNDGNHGTMLKGCYKNITRSVSDRFGFKNYTSCKRTCAVSEPIVYVRPRPSPHYLLGRRSS